MSDGKLDTPPMAGRTGERVLPNGRLRPEGLTQEQVREVVDVFYARVREDDVLGPVFNSVIAPDEWPHHLSVIEAFWSSMLLGTGTYGGRPMPRHIALKDVITDAHFQRWLDLFKKTTVEICAPEVAELFLERAERVGQSFRLQMAFARGEDTTVLTPIRAV